MLFMEVRHMLYLHIHIQYECISQLIHRRVKDPASEVALLCVSFSLTNILLASVDNTDKISAFTIIAGTVAGLQLLSCTRSPKQYPHAKHFLHSLLVGVTPLLL